MKKLLSTLALTYRHCWSMRMIGEVKPSVAEAAESMKAWERRTLAELIVDNEEDKRIFDYGEGAKKKKMKEKEVRKGLISIEDLIKEVVVDKEGKIQASCDVNNVGWKEVAGKRCFCERSDI